jgi:hypothetical protein
MDSVRRIIVPFLAASLIASACSGSEATQNTTTPPTETAATLPIESGAPASTLVDSPVDTSASTATSTVGEDEQQSGSPCSPLEQRSCLLPWPSNELTVRDDTTPTGRRLDLPADATPANVDGVAIDVTDQNRADGFSPGTAVLVFIPDVDLERSQVPNSLDIGSSLDLNSPIRIVNTATDETHPYWAELDAQAPPGEQLLIIHPAIAFDEAATYEVEIDELVTSDGQPVATELPMRWSFTIASAESLSSRLLHIRAAAYEQLEGNAPAFTIAEVTESNGVRTVEGTFDIPNFLTGDGGPANSFILDDEGLPTQSVEAPTYPSRFRCVFGTSAAHSVVLYGHGLLGDRSEVDFFAGTAELLAGCATDWIGMSSEDIPTVVEILADQSRFNEQADRLQQGQLAFQLLGVLVNHPDGFASAPEFQRTDGAPLITNANTTFLGNSQGGILGGAATAISTEWDRAVLGVPAMNYSLLLTRSSDWPQFQSVYDVAYPDPVDRVLGIQLAQLLWDRGENQGYAQHLTSDPYDGFEAKPVVLIGAFGDHQVSNVATDVFARTIDAAVHRPVLTEGRSAQVEQAWGIKAIDGGATDQSSYVMWDYGTPESPADNSPPNEVDHGEDPHGAGSDEPGVLAQALGFLLTGEFVVNCNGPCVGRQIDEI